MDATRIKEVLCLKAYSKMMPIAAKLVLKVLLCQIQHVVYSAEFVRSTAQSESMCAAMPGSGSRFKTVNV
jgi:hypothetical protein